MPNRPNNWRHWTWYVPLPVLWCLCFCSLPIYFSVYFVVHIVAPILNAYREWHSDLGEVWREIRGKVDIRIE